jgi:ABC-type nitrate/sulfonate/bicarbonate transport system substrate-binding protein
MFRSLSGILLALALTAVIAGPAAAQAPKVRLILDFAMQGQQSPFILAAEGGYFARAGVELEVDRGYVGRRRHQGGERRL